MMTLTTRALLLAALALLSAAGPARADWPTLRGNPQRAGYTGAPLRPPFRLAWVRHIVGERLGSAMEPVIAGGGVFLATHHGSVYALDAETGEPAWRFQAGGAFLHSPAVAEGAVVVASVDGNLYALDAVNGQARWVVAAGGGRGGFAASPAVAGGVVYIGSRTGEFLAVELASGRVLWRKPLPAPVRQTAAADGAGHVFVTAEDMRLRCFDAKSGEIAWTSEPLHGQTARDYYPVVASRGGRTFVVVRTNPALQMGRRIGLDRELLTRSAGIDAGTWQKLEAWIKDEGSLGTQQLWEKEQQAIRRALADDPSARTFYAFDALTGRAVEPAAPALWVAGCQGVGTPPVVMPDGRLLVLYRSAYGNWNHGVAPLVALGLLDLPSGNIEPLRHKNGMQPPWNTFWGTADESQNFVAAGDSLLIVHQSTISAFDLKTQLLSTVWGERDSWGKLRHLPWARNEWNGPARGGVAIVNDRIYWQTGSRVLCIAMGAEGKPAADVGIDPTSVPTQLSPHREPPARTTLEQELARAVEELISRGWAPLYVEPGLAGREFFFDDSGEVFEALARAYPFLPADLRMRVQAFLAQEWKDHPPFAERAWYALDEGERRERFTVPKEGMTRLGPEAHHPFGNVYAVELYAGRLGEAARVSEAYGDIRRCFDDFARTHPKVVAADDVHANRYANSLLAFSRMAARQQDHDAARRSSAMAGEVLARLRVWWARSARDDSLPMLKNISEWDRFIGSGDALFLRVIPHRAKLALFRDLTPELCRAIHGEALGRAASADGAGPALEASEKVWRTFETLCPTWHLTAEERQVHYGENFLDPPDFALDAFRAMAFLHRASANQLVERLDVPLSKGDLNHIIKLAILLGQGEGPGEK